MGTRPAVDDVFNGLTCIALGLYTIELVANSLFQPGFAFRFYFWLDLVSTVGGQPVSNWCP